MDSQEQFLYAHFTMLLSDENLEKVKKTDEDLENEIWKPYQNYLVSNYGRVRHATKNNLLKPSLTCGNYKVRLSKKGLTEDKMVHKLVWELFSD